MTVIIPAGPEFRPEFRLKELETLAPMIARVIIVGPVRGPVLVPTPFPVDLLAAEWGNRNRSRNLGALAASTDLLYFLDADVGPTTPDALARAIRSLRGDSGLALIAGPYTDPSALGYWGRCYNLLSNAWAGGGERFLAGHFMIRREVTRFDESLENGGEEEEMADRLRSQGWRLEWRRDFGAPHYCRHSSSTFLERARQHGQSRSRRSQPPQFLRLGAELSRHPWCAIGAILFQARLELSSLSPRRSATKKRD